LCEALDFIPITTKKKKKKEKAVGKIDQICVANTGRKEQKIQRSWVWCDSSTWEVAAIGS
jgi:hypothetical protein